MHDDVNQKLDRLLSQSSLSVQEKEDVLHAALAAAGHGAPASNGITARLRAMLFVPGLTAAAAAALFVVLARTPDEFRARGGGTQAPSSSPWLKVACAAPAPDAAGRPSCPRTSSLRLGIEPRAGTHALAVALLDPEGVLIWSFPDEAGHSAVLDDARFVAVEVGLDPSMIPGEYKVFALRSPTPMTRASARRHIEDALEGGKASRDPDLVAARVVVTQ